MWLYHKKTSEITIFPGSVVFPVLFLKISVILADMPDLNSISESLEIHHLEEYSFELNTENEANNNIKMNLPMPSLIPDQRIISKDPDRVGFYLYPDPANQTYHETLLLGNPNSIKNSRYNQTLPVIFLIHGFLTSFKDSFIQTVKNAYLTVRFPANIIAVDWGEMSTPKAPASYFYYHLAVNNVPVVGDRVAKFILFLLNIQAVKSMDEIHIVGFSLGAHVAGFTGSTVIHAGLTPLRRITGLDPAGPAFQLQPNERRLDSSDARFVDIVHTNQGVKGYLGIMGHVDFFPNGGGPSQPGCANQTDISDVFTGTCSHGRAFVYYAQSILNPNIMACKCTGALKMNKDKVPEDEEMTRTFVDSACMMTMTCNHPVSFGQHCPESARGVYYLSLQSKSGRSLKQLHLRNII